MSSAFSEHEYEPISPPSLPTTLSTLNAQRILNTAPVVRFNDTDVAHVADSDDSTDAQERRYNPNLVLDGDPVVPLDGEIEDNAMQARELGGTGDTSEDQETAQQLQDRLEERFLTAATPCTESRTDAEINTSQVDTSALEEQPLQRGARGFPQRLRSQAGKLRTRLRGIQRPTFSLQLERKKTDKTKTTKAEKPNKDEKPKSAEKSRFSLPDRPKFNLPERPKFNFPERPKFSMPDRPKFNIKKPNINLPSLGRVKKPLKERQHSSESNSSAKRNIFDFSTYPRLFDKKSKSRGDYATSSPKASRAQSPESATVPRVKKKVPIGARWVQRFSDIKYADDEPENAVERSKPWRHPSIEEPQVAFRQETPESRGPLPWEESEDRSVEPSHEKPEEEFNDELRGEERKAGYEEDSVEVDNRRIIVTLPLGPDFLGNPPEDSDDRIDPDLSDPRLYPRITDEDSFEKAQRHKVPTKENWRPEEEEEEQEEEGEEVVMDESVEADEVEDHPDYRKGDKIPRQDSYGRDEYSGEIIPDDEYGGNFLPIDPRKYLARESTPDETSMRSDREQQSSGSSSDRRRRGVLEEIDSDEFFLRAKGISQDDMNMGRFLASEIRDAFRPTGNALADQEFDLAPPTRPVRTRSLRKTRREETTPEVYKATPPARPKRDRRRSEDSMRVDEYETFLPEKTTHGSISGSRHRIIYQAEETPPPAVEPLDDIVVVKPARRKSRSVARSYSEFGSEVFQPPPLPPTPPVAPRRRKRGRREIDPGAAYVNGHGPVSTFCNGHRRELEWPQGIGGFPPEDRDHGGILDREELENFASRLDHEYIEPAPIAPKQKSRSRGTSVADDDRTSRGAESLPEVGYLEEEETAPRELEGDPPGYAVVDKREKPPRPPPPRRRRDKFATTPRSHATPSTSDIPSVPVRPRRAYSTLGPSRRRSSSEDRSVNQMDVTPYTELDDVSDDPDSRELQSGQVLNKIQGRPLPAPPRPPRARRDAPDQVSISSNGILEVAASTQTDPLPDDMVIEEEVTRAKLVMAPSRSGSQILVSTERIASPTFGRHSSQAVLQLPRSVSPERFVEPSDEVEMEVEIAENREAEGRGTRPLTPASPTTSLSLPQEDRIRIASLEVADLRVERLNVNFIETQKVSASEVDAVVVSASEISSTANPPDPGIHPSLLKELIAIRSHLEQAAAARSQGRESSVEIARSEDPPLSAVDELIEALKNSDRSEERTDGVIDESDMIDEPQTLKEEFSEPEKSVDQKLEEQSVEIDQPVENITDIAIAEVQLVPENFHAETLDENTSRVEEISTSVSPRDSSAPDSAPTLSLTPSEGQETLKAHAPTSLTNPTPIPSLITPKDEDRPSKRVSREGKEDRRKSSRSRSPSPTIDGKIPVRQTASPVRSLPPVISVTPDIPDAVPSPIPEAQTQPQRGIISYTRSGEEETGIGASPSLAGAQFVAFPTSQIPASFFSLASPAGSRYETESEPGLVETTQQLLRALRIAGTRAMRHFVGYIASRVSTEERGEKIKEIELALCALLLLIAGLLIMCFGSPRTVTHYHHWDYFNPPQ